MIPIIVISIINPFFQQQKSWVYSRPWGTSGLKTPDVDRKLHVWIVKSWLKPRFQKLILLFVRYIYTYVYLLLFNWSQCPVETVNNVNFVVTQNAIQAATPITAAGLPEQSENEVVLGCEEFQLKLAVWTTEPSTNTTGIYGEQMIRS